MAQGAARRETTEELAPPPQEALFRREVIEARQTQWLGVVFLQPRISHRLFAWTAGLMIVSLSAFMVFGSYTRKVRIAGWLVPQLGLVTISAPQAGSVSKLLVREGESVRRGAPLLSISGELRSEAGGSTRAKIVERLAERRDSQETERELQSKVLEKDEKALRRQVETFTSQRSHLVEEVSLQKTRLNIAGRALLRARQMRARDLISLPRLEQSEQDRLDQAEKLHSLERNLASIEQELVGARTNLEQLPLRRDTQLGAIGRGVAALDQEIAEAEARQGVLLTAPEDGTVSGIRTEVGSDVAINAPLLNIAPEGSPLQAQLYGSSRAVGFIKPGQRVLLRYQAYPYQKFGSYDGRVVEVSHSAISPSELSRSLTGLSSLYGANEPVYRIVVKLAREDVSAYGKALRLKPGMQLDADVMVDTRRLFEWMLDPLYSITGR